jgi:hypothetical protein
MLEDDDNFIIDVLANDTDIDGDTLTITSVGDVVDSAGTITGTAEIVTENYRHLRAYPLLYRAQDHQSLYNDLHCFQIYQHENI